MIDHKDLADLVAEYLNENVLEEDRVSGLTVLDALASTGLCLVPDAYAASQSYVEALTA